MYQYLFVFPATKVGVFVLQLPSLLATLPFVKLGVKVLNAGIVGAEVELL